MADPPPYPGTPTWVKGSAFTAFALILLMALLTITEIRGKHGPSRHMALDVTAKTASSKAPPGSTQPVSQSPLHGGHMAPQAEPRTAKGGWKHRPQDRPR